MSRPLSSRTTKPIIPAEPPVIEIVNLVKGFNGRNVLDGINLTVYRGETLVIMGASGCGKSTLLRCLIGAHRPDDGTVKLFGKELWGLAPKELDAVRRRLGILFQSGALFSSMTVGENVALPLKEHTDLSPEMIDLMVKVKLELVGLREAEHLLPAQISGGMAKRAGLARAIALDPELLFYDEPTSGLDPIMTGIIDGLIMDLARTMNVTSVVVTHDLKSAFRVADRMVVLNNGKVVTVGKPHEIRSCPDSFVRRFIQGPVEAKTAMFPKSAMDKGLDDVLDAEDAAQHVSRLREALAKAESEGRAAEVLRLKKELSTLESVPSGEGRGG
ncbi:MAG: ABC transporter ATP-binding protein [Planctomycetota bacterium]|nr:ABC transporter ATP-binding protein [Planctomycetota bacterium]